MAYGHDDADERRPNAAGDGLTSIHAHTANGKIKLFVGYADSVVTCNTAQTTRKLVLHHLKMEYMQKKS